MKYNVGDVIVETCYKYKKDYRKGYITSVTPCVVGKEHIIGIYWFDIEQEDAYTDTMIDTWIKRNNAKHYPVNKDDEKEIQTIM
jgi:hypothetical protein